MSEKVARAQKKSQTKEFKTFVYCGPSLRNGELQQFSIFRGEPPEHVKKHMEKNIGVRQLFVEVSQLGHVRKNLSKKGTLESQLYSKALEYVRGGSN